ncbi:uncharacterized protein LOC128265094 isoform X2 [Drosophila gunungcola]|uniref:uncharacterized protein LOC128265094 isoform X2 n=1 Tax=Drosophila gunungcola TaxID=103775 RepID=UPI0022E158E5|nr:uncharacterized protein LOC128265094 isoform X2 [Drosophila gunungcola]
MSSGRGQLGPNGSVECINSSRNIQMARCPDLASTPEHLRPGFRGRTHRYDPSDFGLTTNEEWRHPRMFRDMTYETDAAAMETFRQAQPRRHPYDTRINLSNLPDECLADMSAPGFDPSMPSQMSDLRGEFLADVSAPSMCDDSKTMPTNGTLSHADDVYGEILDRFRSIREKINRSNQLRRAEEDKSCDTPCYQQTTRRRTYTHRDPSGHITSHIDETTVSNTSSLDCTPNGLDEEPGRRLNFSLPSRSENLMDESMPSYHEASLPNECLDILDNETMPAFETLGSNSYRSCLENETMPYMSYISEGSRRQQTMPSECLEDVSQPSFERSRSRRLSPRRQRLVSMPSQNLCDISAPSFANSSRVRTTNECLEDISMPSFQGVSQVSRSRSRSRSRSPRQTQRSRHTRNISDISAPTFASSRRGQTTANECLDDMTMPSLGRISRLSSHTNHRQPRRSMSMQNINDISEPIYVSFQRDPMTNECLEEIVIPPHAYGERTSRRQRNSECLEDMTMPSFGGISRASRARSLDRHERSMPSQMMSECLDDMTMPSFGGVSSATRRQMTLPSECLNDVSEPSFGRRSGSRGSSRQQNICDISAPSFLSSTKYGGTSECLENIAMPSFAGTPGASRRKSSRRRQVTMPSQNIGDISAPSFASSGRGNTTNECLEDISMPSFGGVSSASRGRSPKRQQRSRCDPSSRGRLTTNECLVDMTMPSLGGTSSSSRRPMDLPSECLNDVSAPPSFGRSISRAASRRQRTLPSRNPCASSTRCPQTNECLEDISMPSFGGVSVASTRRQLTMPSECLADICAPSFGGNSDASRRQTTGLPNECLDNVSMPTFGDISAVTRRSECLEDVRQPALGRSRSVGRSPRSRKNLSRSQVPNKCLEDVTMPSFGGISGSSRRKSNSRRQKAPLPSVMRTNECLEDVSMPSYGGVSGVSRAKSARQRTMPSRHIQDISAPTFASSGRGYTTNDCLDDETMPSFGVVSQSPSGRSSRRQAQSIRSGRGFDTNECIEDISMPSCAENTQSFRAKSSTSVQRSRHGAMTNECLEEVTMPSFGTSSRSPAANECLEDISMPQYDEHTGSSRGRCPTPMQSSRRIVLSNECLDDITMPSFGTSRRGLVTNECLQDISMPSYGGNSRLSRVKSTTPLQRSQQMTAECLDDMTMPSFGTSSRSPATNECLEDISMPSFGESRGSSRRRCPTPTQVSRQGMMTNECLDDMTMPSFGTSVAENAGSSRRRCPTPTQVSRQGMMTNECLDDMTMPSFGTVPDECLGDISMPSYRRNTERSLTPGQRPRQEMMTDECLNDMTMPSYGEAFASPRRQIVMPSECLNDVSAPSFVSGTSEGTSRRQRILMSQTNTDCGGWPASRGRSPRMPQMSMTNECLEDMTMPTFGGVSGSSRRGQSAMDSVRLEDMSMPSGLSHRTQYGECVEDNVSGEGGRRHRLLAPLTTNECLEDVSAPSFAASSRTASRHLPQFTNECLEDVSMPLNDSLSRNVSKSTARRPPDISYPSEMLANESAPAYQSANCTCSSSSPSPPPQQSSRSLPWEKGSAGCLEDETMPTFEDVSYQPRRHQLTMPSENLADITEPSFSRSRSKVGDTGQPGLFHSTGLPSSTRKESLKGKSPRQEHKRDAGKQLADESAPSILKDAAKGPSEVVKEVTVQSSKTSVTRVFNNTPDGGNNSGQPMIEDLSMPPFEATDPSAHESRHQDASLHGFRSMDNYRPFDELIYSQDSVGNQTQPQPQTPQPVRSASRGRSVRRPPSNPSNLGGNVGGATRTPGQPCDMVGTSYPHGKPHCYTRKPC